jgi:hypothetical protein
MTGRIDGVLVEGVMGYTVPRVRDGLFRTQF